MYEERYTGRALNEHGLAVTVWRVGYHRNGDSGEGFYVLEFDFEDQEESGEGLIAIVFPNDFKYTAVWNPNDRNQHYHGDHFAGLLRKAINRHNRRRSWEQPDRRRTPLKLQAVAEGGPRERVTASRATWGESRLG
jgi:hypothetical protein